MMTGALLKTVFWTTGPDGEKPFSEWYVAFMSGALKVLKAPEKLANLIKGESLCNDGSAVVMFFVFRDLAEGTMAFDYGAIAAKAVQMTAVAPLLALGFFNVAFVWCWFTQQLANEVLIVLMSVYALFFCSELPSINISAV